MDLHGLGAVAALKHVDWKNIPTHLVDLHGLGAVAALKPYSGAKIHRNRIHLHGLGAVAALKQILSRLDSIDGKISTALEPWPH